MKFDNDSLLDDINLKTIDVLSKDSSMPFVEIALFLHSLVAAAKQAFVGL
jgi:hypothetical protein